LIGLFPSLTENIFEKIDEKSILSWLLNQKNLNLLIDINKSSNMQNNLQKLTEKIYQEGIEKANEEAEKLLAKAREEALQIIREAEKEKNEILAEG
jgi:F0F1-type ATP synthase membrane subunit b/b'